MKQREPLTVSDSRMTN